MHKIRIAMPNRILSLILVSFISLAISCKSGHEPAKSYAENLIPKPLSISYNSGEFALGDKTNIFTLGDSPELQKVAQYLSGILKPATGFSLPVSASTAAPANGNIYLKLSSEGDLGEEGYTLNVSTENIQLSAATPAGLFRGIQTIRQLLPPGIEMSTVQPDKWIIPSISITDKPEYAYRGSMLDVARHFFSVEDVKRYIDLIAAYKMNVIHLHLSDDQGWRIEIKSWPKLTETGGSTQVGGGKGGFYTQEQYKDIVQYAADRYITIIPEIDMPGHTNAALASYPELNCNDSATKLYSGIEVGFSTLCTNKPVTYKFLDDVIRELSELTPGPYIHIGGDESHATKKEDYIPFINKVQPMVTKYGKTVIGWDEIALSTLQPNTIVQFWADAENSKEAVRQGAKVIMSPAKKAYLDMQYDSTSKLGLHWAGYIEVDTAYIWDPANYVDSITRLNIVGVEAPLWTETIVTMDDIEYMVFPRLPGYAEIGWSQTKDRNWDEYKKRLASHGPRMKAMNIDFYPSAKVPWKAN
jgi:hexosaminidase